jgi:hypothetical protein
MLLAILVCQNEAVKLLRRLGVIEIAGHRTAGISPLVKTSPLVKNVEDDVPLAAGADDRLAHRIASFLSSKLLGVFDEAQ